MLRHSYSPSSSATVAGAVSAAESVSKRLVDVFGAAILLSFLAPLLLLIAIAISLTSRGPALFRQKRTGLREEVFFIYKFRTMHVCEDGLFIKQATPGDRRITTLGRMLRKTSLDELPQLLNVLRGEMSLIGPRPHALAHDYFFGAAIHGYRYRFAVRPGITGLAQVRGLRGETSTIDVMAARIAADLEYCRSWSLSSDMKILVRSLGIVFRGDGV